MSLDATRWAWAKQDLRPIQKLILLSLADRADSDDCVWPSYDQLAFDTGADRKTIWQAIKQMKEAGMLEDTGKRMGNTGQVVVFRLVGVEHRENQEEFPKRNGSKNGIEASQKRNSSKNGTVPKTDRKGSENGTCKGSENGIRNLPVEPTSNQPRDIHTRKPADIVLLEGYGITGQLAADFVKHRKTIHGAITVTALDRFRSEAEKAGITTAEAVEISIIKNWRGFNSSWNWRDSKPAAQTKPSSAETAADIAYRQLFGATQAERDITHEAERI